jgi:hypothetical protein
MHVWIDSGTLSDCRLVDFVFSTTQTYLLVITDKNVAVYQDDVFMADVRLPSHSSSILSTLSWTQSADTLLLFANTVTPWKLVRNNSDIFWISSAITFDYTPKYNFVPTESNPAQTLTPSATTGNITLTAGGAVFSASDVGQYVSGNAGRARIVAYTSTTVVDAVVEIPFFDAGAIASGAWTLEAGYEAVWSATRGYPGCGVFHEGRLWLAGSTQRPSTIWGSRVGLFFDFDPGSVLDDDAIDATLDTGQYNKIINLYSGRALMIFTTGGEHAVLQQLNEAITPGNFNAKKQTSIGSREGLRVVEAEGGVMYVQRQGESVQEMIYADTEQAFISNIVSLLSSHLIITPVDFALRKATSTSDGNYLLVVNSDGTLTVGCIQRSQLITAFAPQVTDGTFKRAGIDDDGMYFMIERQFGSITYRFLEKFNFDYTLDAAERSSVGVPATTFSGFNHLEGESVVAKIDGNDVVDVDVISGAVDVGNNIISVQPFEITIATSAATNTATITAVDTSRSLIIWGGFTTTTTFGTPFRDFLPRLALTNATTVTATRNTASASFTTTVRGTVVEFSSRVVSTVEYGTITIPSSTASATASITPIDLTRSAVFYLGATNSGTTTNAFGVYATVELTDASTVTATRGSSSTTEVLTVPFAVVKFKSSVIQSVQRRSISISGTTTDDTDTITPVTFANTMLAWGGISSSSPAIATFATYIQLAGDGASVSLSRTSSTSASRRIVYTVIEFVPGVLNSHQRSVTSLASDASEDSAISSVSTSLAFCSLLGFKATNSGASTEHDTIQPTVKLQSSTAVRAQKNTAGTNTVTPSWQVIEFEASALDVEEYIEVGIDYTPTVVDLPLEEDRIGTAHGLKKNVSEINLQLYQTKNITVNGRVQTFAGFDEAANNDADDGFTGIKRIKGERGWSLTGQVTISQDKALPMTVLTMSKKVNM